MKTTSLKCPVALASRVLGGKWKARVIWTLQREGPLRFSDIRRALPPISDRILTHELRELEAWDLIQRDELAVSPAPLRTEYRLSEFGRTLEPVMAAMADWGNRHRAKLNGETGEPE